jgi:manganese oxidase
MIGMACVFGGTTMEANCAKTARGRMVVASFVLGLLLGVTSTITVFGSAPGDAIEKCARIVHADVVALDQCLVFNRYGTALPDGMLFALRRNVVPAGGTQQPGQPLAAGKVNLASNKRPRPIVLRANQGDCLEICFTNLLGTVNSVVTTNASVHVQGLELIHRLDDDGSWAGVNDNGLASPATTPSADCSPGESRTYRLFAREEGIYYLFSQGAPFGGANQISNGLFGMVIVEPKGSTWYRSQVTAEVLEQARVKGISGTFGHPLIDYDSLDKDGVPLLNMLKKLPPRGNVPAFELCHTDLTAIITGPDAANSPDRWLFRAPGPRPDDNPVYPRPWEPYRELAIIYHDLIGLPLAQPFNYGSMSGTMANGKEAFAINYGSVAIGTEIWANRFGVGPAANAVDAKFEEFFLSSWVGGDPGIIVDAPANAIAPVTPGQLPDCSKLLSTGAVLTPGVQLPKATVAFYPDDPSNVYHSYLNDRVKFRILHGGPTVPHVHHQHAHQWLRTPASSDSKLLDSQTITPGDAFTLEMIYGSGNRNLTPGDSIFHCHFYPHLAGGLWALWRVHDVFEAGTQLVKGSDLVERPAPGSRALPDGEIAAGTPIPAVVPMPTLPMAPVPAKIVITPVKVPAAGGLALPGFHAELAPGEEPGRNPGYPFFIPGIAGRRAPQPPLDFARDELTGQPLDGGLPRHIVLGGTPPYQKETSFDFSRDNYLDQNGDPNGKLLAQQLPEDGTPTERVAMRFHHTALHPTDLPDGSMGEFRTNGGVARAGAPYADPAINAWNEYLRRRSREGKASDAEQTFLRREDLRDPGGSKRTVQYKSADIQLDVVFNKKGWHYPQQRISSLWGDVSDVLSGKRKPQPLIARANSGDLVEYWLTNLLPGYYEVDDFQVRTPTDIVGQHIHLVKFDVTSSDGAANGFNYQDGSYGPDEVTNRIKAINNSGGLFAFDRLNQYNLAPRATPFFGGAGSGGQPWTGAQTTVQLWYADRLLDEKAARPVPRVGSQSADIAISPPEPRDRTLQSVFTHDHFAPSTHQQIGLYAALIIEPKDTRWSDSETGVSLGERMAQAIAPGGPSTRDGGPTSWQALIVPDKVRHAGEGYREFVLEFQDSQLAYQPGSVTKLSAYTPYPGPTTPTTYKGWTDFSNAILPPTGTTAGASAPSIITGGEPGGRMVNYRSEPIPYRVNAPTNAADLNPAPDPFAADLAHAFRSITRKDNALNRQPTGPIASGSPFSFPPPFTGAQGQDPYTPLLRVYENDRVQIRALVGAHHEPHVFNLQGLMWQTEVDVANSGFRANQVMSISEHFEMSFTVPPATVNSAVANSGDPPSTDYLYQPSADIIGTSDGVWGLLRSYRGPAPKLASLPANPPSANPVRAQEIQDLLANVGNKRAVRKYTVVAVTIQQALGGNTAGLVYNSRFGTVITDPNAIVYVLSTDLETDDTLVDPHRALEPLVLRANAGDVIEITLENHLDPNAPVFATANKYPTAFASSTGTTSKQVGLHPQLVGFDVNKSNGFNVGQNSIQTVKPQGTPAVYRWYAGELGHDRTGHLDPRPVEFGTIGLAPADPLFQHPHGLVGVLVIEPEGSTWSDKDRTIADITPTRSLAGANGLPPKPFREFVLVLQDLPSNQQVVTPGLAGLPANLAAVNFRNEPMIQRYQKPASFNGFAGIDISQAFSNSKFNPPSEPQTPILKAKAGDPVRFRLVHTGGQTYWAWNLQGHSWQRSPYQNRSAVLAHNPISEQTGSVGPMGPYDQADVLIDHAGGRFGVSGDYLYRVDTAGQAQSGQWGILRVHP